MQDARTKTLWLLSMVPEEYLNVRVHSFYSPIGWHFGHIGRTEEYWILHKGLGRPVVDDHLSFLFADLPENPKDNRVHLPSRSQIVEYLEITRDRCLEAMEGAEFGSDHPFLRDGYAWEFALQHECQHQETICEMLQLIHQHEGLVGDLPSAPWPEAEACEYVTIRGGSFVMGCDDLCVYDNEQRAHEVEVASFRLARIPVTANQWRQFMEDGGYSREELWSVPGWAWKVHEGAEAPEYWSPYGESYAYYGPRGLRELNPEEPVTSLSWFEADAYCRWAGKRMPTEEEWEYAASFAGGPFPWGAEEPNSKTAAFGIGSWGPVPAGSLTCGATPSGVCDLAGNVWEWTSSRFLPYPGFKAFPYEGYSQDHMKGEHYVCRGGSWATAAPILRRTFRNWYVPTYRQGFLGLRCAE
jgi:iron(II)-dependent oxidoreductase